MYKSFHSVLQENHVAKINKPAILPSFVPKVFLNIPIVILFVFLQKRLDNQYPTWPEKFFKIFHRPYPIRATRNWSYGMECKNSIKRFNADFLLVEDITYEEFDRSIGRLPCLPCHGRGNVHADEILESKLPKAKTRSSASATKIKNAAIHT